MYTFYRPAKMTPPRTIIHLDMDAFFASVEQACHPGLHGRPVLVCGAQSRTVVLSPSYEARAFGVKTGMTVPQARQLCPQVVCVPADNDKYADTCHRIISILEDYTPMVEVFSIDEAFLDITRSLKLFHGTQALVNSIRARIRQEVGLSCSIGLAPNKLLAKLGSGLEKPGGLVIIRPEAVGALLEKLPVQELCGIGPSLTAALDRMGIRTCGALGRVPVETLRSRFGIMGEHLHAMGRGVDDSPVIAQEAAPEARSVGHSMTLPRDSCHQGVLLRTLLKLSEKVARRMRRGNVRGRVVRVTIRHADFSTQSRQQARKQPLDDGLILFRAARRIFDGMWHGQRLRLLGVSVSRLVHSTDQLSLFPGQERQRAMMAAMDNLNDRYGESCLIRGSLLGQGRHEEVISPAWRPRGIRHHIRR